MTTYVDQITGGFVHFADGQEITVEESYTVSRGLYVAFRHNRTVVQGHLTLADARRLRDAILEALRRGADMYGSE